MHQLFITTAVSILLQYNLVFLFPPRWKSTTLKSRDCAHLPSFVQTSSTLSEMRTLLGFFSVPRLDARKYLLCSLVTSCCAQQTGSTKSLCDTKRVADSLWLVHPKKFTTKVYPWEDKSKIRKDYTSPNGRLNLGVFFDFRPSYVAAQTV